MYTSARAIPLGSAEHITTPFSSSPYRPHSSSGEVAASGHVPGITTNLDIGVGNQQGNGEELLRAGSQSKVPQSDRIQSLVVLHEDLADEFADSLLPELSRKDRAQSIVILNGKDLDDGLSSHNAIGNNTSHQDTINEINGYKMNKEHENEMIEVREGEDEESCEMCISGITCDPLGLARLSKGDDLEGTDLETLYFHVRACAIRVRSHWYLL